MNDPDRDDRFTELFRQHYRDLYAYVLALVRDFSDAEDVLQETSVTLWEKFDEFDPDTNFRAWACRVAKFKALNFVRRKGAQKRTAHDMAFLEQLADAATERPPLEDANPREALQHCIERLSEKQRRLLSEYYGSKKTVPEIARQHERTADSIYGTLAHTRRNLRDCIDRYLARGTDR